MVSVIIPSFNRKSDLRKAIQSVREQSYTDHEIIVVDDGSTDGTKEYLNQNFPEIIVIRHETSQGGSVARNAGARRATGEYVAFLDSDDRWLPNHLTSKIDFLKRAGADGVYSSFYNQVENDEPIRMAFNARGLRRGNMGDMIFGNQRFDARTSTFIFKREAFLSVAFDEKLRKHQDWDLAIAFDKQFDFAFMEDATVVLSVSREAVRMSNSLNHHASIYFLNKNQDKVSKNALFLFCLKMVYRCEMRNEPKEIRRLYLQFSKQIQNELSLKFRIIYFLVSSGLLSATFFHRLKRAVQ